MVSNFTFTSGFAFSKASMIDFHMFQHRHQFFLSEDWECPPAISVFPLSLPDLQHLYFRQNYHMQQDQEPQHPQVPYKQVFLNFICILNWCIHIDDNEFLHLYTFSFYPTHPPLSSVLRLCYLRPATKLLPDLFGLVINTNNNTCTPYPRICLACSGIWIFPSAMTSTPASQSFWLIQNRDHPPFGL